MSYGVLVIDFYRWRPDDLRAHFPTRLDRHVIFALGLLAIAGVVAYLVNRLRTLSSYYGQKLSRLRGTSVACCCGRN